MIVPKACKYRIYPNTEQQRRLAVQFGHTRFVYHWGLAMRKEADRQKGQGLRRNATLKRLPARKKEKPWLYEADSQALSAILRSLCWEAVKTSQIEETPERWDATRVSAFQEQAQ
jgi:putative transposase